MGEHAKCFRYSTQYSGSHPGPRAPREDSYILAWHKNYKRQACKVAGSTATIEIISAPYKSSAGSQPGFGRALRQN